MPFQKKQPDKPKPTKPDLTLGDFPGVALDAEMTLQGELAAIDKWYGEALANLRTEYKARRKKALAHHEGKN